MRNFDEVKDSSFDETISIKEPVNGYNVSVRLGDYFEYTFLSDSSSFVIVTPFVVGWDTYKHKKDVGKQTVDIHCQREFIQEENEIFIPTPFCFKDVDFDGEKEICLRLMGWNRKYYSIIKIIGGKPFLMTAHPYNNIVSEGDYIAAETYFDYKLKKIKIVEQIGLHYSECVYELKTEVLDLLDPMTLVAGEDSDLN